MIKLESLLCASIAASLEEVSLNRSKSTSAQRRQFRTYKFELQGLAATFFRAGNDPDDLTLIDRLLPILSVSLAKTAKDASSCGVILGSLRTPRTRVFLFTTVAKLRQH